LLQLFAALLLTPEWTFASPGPHQNELAGFSFNELFARWDCGGTSCGADSQYCCTAGQACVTNAQNIALCTASSESPATAVAGGGAWQYYTTTYVETDLVTRTSVWSSYIGGGATPAPTAPNCNYALNESPCGPICCASDQYCYVSGQCNPVAGGSSEFYSTHTAGAPIRPTSSGELTVTRTAGPTTTMPFMTPVATGANITVTGSQQDNNGGGLSGGAIAGIVIGVLAGLLLLAALCFFCCLKGLLDGCLACFGLGGRKKKRTEIEEYERHSHHSHGGGGRTWYGAAPPPPPGETPPEHKSSGKNLLGVGAGLAALWAVLGLKRKRDGRRNDEKYSEYSYSSDYYTSASKSSMQTVSSGETDTDLSSSPTGSASSDDRRTRNTRYSRR
jgi:hypothetical protein